MDKHYTIFMNSKVSRRFDSTFFTYFSQIVQLLETKISLENISQKAMRLLHCLISHQVVRLNQKPSTHVLDKCVTNR